MTDSRSELSALAERLSGHLGPFRFLTAQERDLVVSALRLAASQPQPDREMVARAIDPDAFESIDNPIFNRLDYDVDRTSSALNAAGRVCLLLSGEVVQKSDGGVEGHAIVDQREADELRYGLREEDLP